MKKIISSLICVLALFCFGMTAVAVLSQKAEKAEGTAVSEIVDRVNFKVEGVKQTFSEADGSYMAEIRLTAEKTEADFYAIMNDTEIKGMTYEKIEIVPADEENGVSYYGAVLPAKDGKTSPLHWVVRIYFSSPQAQNLKPVLSIDFTSGVKKETATRHLFEQPLEFVFHSAK